MRFKVGDKINVKPLGRFAHQSEHNPFTITGITGDDLLPYQLRSLKNPEYSNTYHDQDFDLIGKDKIHSSGGNL